MPRVIVLKYSTVNVMLHHMDAEHGVPDSDSSLLSSRITSSSAPQLVADEALEKL